MSKQNNSINLAGLIKKTILKPNLSKITKPISKDKVDPASIAPVRPNHNPSWMYRNE